MNKTSVCIIGYVRRSMKQTRFFFFRTQTHSAVNPHIQDKYKISECDTRLGVQVKPRKTGGGGKCTIPFCLRPAYG